MEEAEALSTKMGIMVKGGLFKCFGSPQYIKNKYSLGFEIQIKNKIPSLKRLQLMAKEELRDNFIDNENVNIKDTFAILRQKGLITQLLEDQILEDLTEQQIYYFSPAYIFMEKLAMYRAQMGVMRQLAKDYGPVHVVEHFGAYMRLKIPSNWSTIGQMFGVMEQLKTTFSLDQYSVS